MPGKRRPRPWSPLDREYLAQDTIRELGQKFGPAGPLVFLALVLEAGKTPSGGRVEMRYRGLAQLAFVDADKAREVIAAACKAELLDEFEGDSDRFKAHLTRYDAWEARDPTSAQRSVDYRARNSAP
jgi:hypothetical protein